MADVQLSIKVANGVTVPAMPRKTAAATYSREVTEANSTTGEATTSIIQDAVQAALGDDATASLALPSVAPNTSIHVRFLSGTGATRLERTIAVPEGVSEVSLELSETDVKALAEPELSAEAATEMMRRVGQLVATNTTPVTFRPTEFRIAIIDPADWTSLGLDTVFNMAALQTTSAAVSPDTPAQIAGLTWLPVHLGIGGGFDVLLPAAPGKAWLWWFSDLSNVALGAVKDDLGTRQPDTMTLPLPPFAAPPEGGPGGGPPGRVPVDITESELADNPDVFTEDPGAFCRPFSNPERILGERAFHVILRAEQPTLSSEPTRKFPTFPLFDFDPPILAEQPAPPARGGGLRSIADRIRAAAVRPVSLTSIPLGEAVNRGMTMVRPTLPARLPRSARHGESRPRRDQRRQSRRLGGRCQPLPGRHGGARPHPRVPPPLAIERLLPRHRRQDADRSRHGRRGGSKRSSGNVASGRAARNRPSYVTRSLMKSPANGPTRTPSRRAWRSGRGASRSRRRAPELADSDSRPVASSSVAEAAIRGRAAARRRRVVGKPEPPKSSACGTRSVASPIHCASSTASSSPRSARRKRSPAPPRSCATPTTPTR